MNPVNVSFKNEIKAAIYSGKANPNEFTTKKRKEKNHQNLSSGTQSVVLGPAT